MNLTEIQAALRKSKVDGWLFYDFHNRDAIAARILDMDQNRFMSRRWFYFIPSEGEPQKLVHRIESWRCDHLPGEKHVYLPWQQQHQLLKAMLDDAKKIAMQYSPNNAIPYVSIVDAGTVELIRSFGVEVVSSADLVGQFEAHLSAEDYHSHKEASAVMHSVCDATFAEIGKRIEAGESPTEFEIQQFMHERMREQEMHWDDGPIVAVNAHAADPHFEPSAENCWQMKEGDLVLLDLWAKKNRPGSIYFDITWMGYIGKSVPDRHSEIFNIVKNARDTAIALVEEKFASRTPVHGWEVDDACRKVIVDAGYGDYFTHRTGHNIGLEVHGNGVHIDNLETKDERLILPGTCFSIEPGIYLQHENFGIRSEVDVFVTDDGKVEVTGPKQESIVAILVL